jgi:hypothetical protein
LTLLSAEGLFIFYMDCGIGSPLVPRVEKSDSLTLSDFLRGQYLRTKKERGRLIVHALNVLYCPRALFHGAVCLML